MTAIWAHRGACAYAPENTIPAFQLAIDMAADGVELDVQRTADGHLVIIHDETINRTSNGVGKVVDLTLEELRRCDFTNGFVGRRNLKIPTLNEALELFRPTNLTVNIELKNSVELYPGMELEVVKAVSAMGMDDQVLYSSFNHFSLAELRGLVAPENLALLLTDGLLDPWSYANWFGAGAINPDYRTLQQPGFVWLAHEAGIKVNTWIVNKDEDAQRLAESGVDAIITNFPDRVGDAVRRPGF
ncbi:glycerophosphoryl diester phosphodiesterase [Tessaracoccus bendigoensis DSM 12906]|uniref:Glycerophosphoryl diester phosphodiesterase n=1 Tax=Tessaracoccus bendigoensis DSM 12906 TaxID=1123357 RepID=A0A1M6JCQ5_9ACTN|nr:glycerophosphodiester phosphodiesterase family protein [Tessaracoccus bendigoensis]SHJ44487.1 glycerophosphoryl diester phosphodiesterase [Tessaracoccus bendigoensis DSM 12906]